MYLTVLDVAEKTAIVVIREYFVRIFVQVESNVSCAWVSYCSEMYVMFVSDP
jgi:hypothetical protein